MPKRKSAQSMCAQYSIKTTSDKLLEQINLIDLSTKIEIDQRLLPHAVGPVIVHTHLGTKLTPMRFSLVPSWSAEPKVKFATHNARIETILEKPTWKQPFLSQHCVVPMTAFYEAAYTGPLAGNMIKFESENNSVIFAAGIFDFWKDKSEPKNSFFSFSIVTRDPSDFIVEQGHDRTPIFIPANFISQWLAPNEKSAELIKVKAQLLTNAYHPNLKVDVDRALKAGWEKRK